MKSKATEGKFILKDITYDITGATILVENADMEIILFPDIEAETTDEDVEDEMSSVRLYHNSGFNTHLSAFEQLKGQKFVWKSEYNGDEEEAGTLYVQEHENVQKGTIEILDIKDALMTMRWSGRANVFWDEKYDGEVPFETVFSVELPTTKIYRLDAYKAAGMRIDSDTRLEIVNLVEFTKELEELSCSKKWEQFNSVLKFKLTSGGVDYFGEVIFANGKNNYTTKFDDGCSREVCFNGFDFNLAENYEVFLFEIE